MEKKDFYTIGEFKFDSVEHTRLCSTYKIPVKKRNDDKINLKILVGVARKGSNIGVLTFKHALNRGVDREDLSVYHIGDTTVDVKSTPPDIYLSIHNKDKSKRMKTLKVLEGILG